MSVQIYQDPDFKIYKAGDGYIVHNKHKSFREGHTHVKNYSICLIMIRLIERREMPKSRNKYFIESLIRISDDIKYIDKVKLEVG